MPKTYHFHPLHLLTTLLRRRKSVLFEFSKRRELTMERCYRLGIKHIASAFTATLNSNIEWWPHDDVMERHSQGSEWLQEPRPNNL